MSSASSNGEKKRETRGIALEAREKVKDAVAELKKAKKAENSMREEIARSGTSGPLAKRDIILLEQPTRPVNVHNSLMSNYTRLKKNAEQRVREARQAEKEAGLQLRATKKSSSSKKSSPDDLLSVGGRSRGRSKRSTTRRRRR
jgi:hypothetical protein